MQKITAVQIVPRREGRVQLSRIAEMRRNCHRNVQTEMSEKPLTRQQAIERLVAFEPDIRALGVQRLALFGSVARGQARLDSDVDILVQFFPDAKTYDRF